AGTTMPVNIGEVTPIATIGGPEPFKQTGAANPILIRNDILTDGTWAMVSSGHPARILEIGFQEHRLRSNTNIWHRLSGKITCGTDAEGTPTFTVDTQFTDATKFPSHRSYLYDAPAGGEPKFVRIQNSLRQGTFSNLWFLPPIPS